MRYEQLLALMKLKHRLSVSSAQASRVARMPWLHFSQRMLLRNSPRELDVSLLSVEPTVDGSSKDDMAQYF